MGEYTHERPPRGYGPCTRPDGHTGPCALPSLGIRTEMSLREFRDHLDGCIRQCRRDREEAIGREHDAERERAIAYVDAFQSMRTSLFGELLGIDIGSPEIDQPVTVLEIP